jgi:hypothetical protein
MLCRVGFLIVRYPNFHSCLITPYAFLRNPISIILLRNSISNNYIPRELIYPFLERYVFQTVFQSFPMSQLLYVRSVVIFYGNLLRYPLQVQILARYRIPPGNHKRRHNLFELLSLYPTTPTGPKDRVFFLRSL